MKQLFSKLASQLAFSNLNRGIWVVVSLLTSLTSCETELVNFEGPYHVRFTDVTLSEKESNHNVIRIEVHNAGPAIENELTITYSISGDARENIDYTVLGTRGVVSIPEGEYFGYIEVKLINNANNILRSQDLLITLNRVNSNDLEVGQGKGGIGKVCTLTIEDDCLLSGFYIGKQGTSSNTISDIAMTSSDCESYFISNWDINLMGSADPVPLIFIDNGDNTLTIKEQTQSIYYGFGNEEVLVSGVGSVNPTTRVIFLSLNYKYTDINGNERDRTSTLTFTPEQ